MNFLLNVIRIFFRNKGEEIGRIFHMRGWYNFLEALMIVGIIIIIATILASVCYFTGWVIVDVMEWVDVVSGRDEPVPLYVVGFAFWFSIVIFFVVVYGIGKFFKWIWSNIKMAVAEAKELN
jgi:hypothetical protein